MGFEKNNGTYRVRRGKTYHVDNSENEMKIEKTVFTNPELFPAKFKRKGVDEREDRKKRAPITFQL